MPVPTLLGGTRLRTSASATIAPEKAVLVDDDMPEQPVERVALKAHVALLQTTRKSPSATRTRATVRRRDEELDEACGMRLAHRVPIHAADRRFKTRLPSVWCWLTPDLAAPAIN
jgi:hypothetical protein